MPVVMKPVHVARDNAADMFQKWVVLTRGEALVGSQTASDLKIKIRLKRKRQSRILR